jgi:hypothetical protein
MKQNPGILCSIFLGLLVGRYEPTLGFSVLFMLNASSYKHALYRYSIRFFSGIYVPFYVHRDSKRAVMPCGWLALSHSLEKPYIIFILLFAY